MMSAQAPIWKFVLLATLACFFIHGCGILFWSNTKPVPVEEVDAHGISLTRAHKLKRGDGAESVVALFGEPADRLQSVVPGTVVWRYPIRAWNDMANSREIVPATLLRVSFDESGTLIDWGFLDSFTGRPLAIRETSDDASRWFQSLTKAVPPIPPRVELHKTLIRGQTTQLQVERMLGQWRPDFYGNGGPVPVVKKTTTDSGSVWYWYVDRPSPLFVPPHYLVVSFDDTGVLAVWHLEQTYPGGRK